MSNDKETAMAYIANRDRDEGTAWSEDTEELSKLLCQYAEKRIEEAQKALINELKKVIDREITWHTSHINRTTQGIGSKECFLKGLQQAGVLISGCFLPEIGTCPFCGRTKGRLHLNFDYVYCPDCGARGQMFDGHPYDAVESWNSLSKFSEEQEEKDPPNA